MISLHCRMLALTFSTLRLRYTMLLVTSLACKECDARSSAQPLPGAENTHAVTACSLWRMQINWVYLAWSLGAFSFFFLSSTVASDTRAPLLIAFHVLAELLTLGLECGKYGPSKHDLAVEYSQLSMWIVFCVQRIWCLSLVTDFYLLSFTSRIPLTHSNSTILTSMLIIMHMRLHVSSMGMHVIR